MKKKERFIETFRGHAGSWGDEVKIIVDSETGVNYLVTCNSYGSGITPLLDKNGLPVLTPVDSTDSSTK